MPVITLLGSVVSTFGAPQYFGTPQYYGRYGYQLVGSPYRRYQSAPVQPSNSNTQYYNNPNFVQPARVVPQPTVLTRSSANTINNVPLGLTVDFDGSFGKYQNATCLL